MKTFLQSAIDCEKFKSGWHNTNTIDNEQFNIVTNLYSCIACDTEHSVWFLLFIAAERGEL